MQKITFKPIPIFRIFDVNKAKEFYVDYLGFQVDWENRFELGAPVYMQISRGGFVLHLTEQHGDCCPGSTVYVDTEGLDALYREITQRRYRYIYPRIKNMPWGERVLEVIDPFGNRLRFNQMLENAAHGIQYA